MNTMFMVERKRRNRNQYLIVINMFLRQFVNGIDKLPTAWKHERETLNRIRNHIKKASDIIDNII